MDKREFELMLSRLMKLDFSIGAETFRENLLSRCLAVLNMDGESAVLDDSELELLAAAGDRFAIDEAGMDSNGRIGDNRDIKNLP